MNRWLLSFLLALVALVPMTSVAQSLDVLWYAYSPPGAESQYREKIQELADNAHAYPAGSGVRWQLTFYGPGETPDFSAYDVLVTQSSLFLGDDVEGDLYSGITGNRAAIEAARGSRTLITGLDPDFHYVFVPGPVNDGPRGLLVNFVNWAGSGTGLGIVALDEEDFQWWTSANSFLRDEVAAWTLRDCCSGQHIAPFAAAYPINAGLSDAAFTSLGVHSAFDLGMPGYVGIHQSINDFEEPPVLAGTTMVTASEAGGATTPLSEYWCESLLPPLDREISLPANSRRLIPVRMVLLDDMGDPVAAADLSQPPQVQVRFDGSTDVVGAFDYQPGPGVWKAVLDSSDYTAPGTYTIEAVAGDASYEVQLCEQTFTRL